jgi:hypothetical protein
VLGGVRAVTQQSGKGKWTKAETTSLGVGFADRDEEVHDAQKVGESPVQFVLLLRVSGGGEFFPDTQILFVYRVNPVEFLLSQGSTSRVEFLDLKNIMMPAGAVKAQNPGGGYGLP